jgi:hypothetical protein
MRIRCGDVPVGFMFEPGTSPEQTLRFELAPGQRAEVSVHGDGAGGCRLDDRPILPGERYELHDGSRLHTATDVGVHLRPANDEEQPPSATG